MMRRCGAWLPLLLAGCASASAPPSPPPQPDLEPPYRTIIAERIDVMFAKDSQMHAVAISGARRVFTPGGQEWRVCLRGTAKSVSGMSNVQTYAIFINKRGEITDRRLARPEDDCGRERFERLRRA